MITGYLVATILTASARAQNLDFSVSPSPVGSGARAAGMADAFVGLADDATAASWNPAGLIQLERPEVSVVGAFNYFTEQIHSGDDRFSEPSATDFRSELNFLSFTYPFSLPVINRNITLSVSYQKKYQFGRDFGLDADLSFVNQFDQNVQQFRTFDFTQSGGLATITPAIAIELTHTLSIGAAFNLWRSSFFSQNDWERELVVTNEVSIDGTPVPTTVRTAQERYNDLSGENFTIGALWTPNQRWSIGARYDTGWTGDVNFSAREFGTNTPLQESSEDRHLTFPDSFTIGVAHRFNDRLTMSFDVTFTDWNDFVLTDGSGAKTSLITGEDTDSPDATHLDITHTIRLGAEYVFVPKQPKEQLKQLWTVRGGLYYNEEPASNRPDSGGSGDGAPDQYLGVAAGFGVQAFQRVNIDVGYQARFGWDVESDRISGLSGFGEDVIQHRLLISAVIYF